MQDAPLDALDSPDALSDSLAVLLDSLATVDSLSAADSIAEADTTVISDERGIGAVASELEAAAEQVADGDLGGALSLAGDALLRFTLESLIPALLVGLAFWFGYRVIRGVLHRALGRTDRIDVGVEQLILRVVRIAVFAFAAVTVLSQLGIQVAPLIAGLGIAGLAIGFAAQDTVRNLIAGVTILLDRPFRVGDNIELQDTFGTVEEITLRSTRVRTLDNQIAILPNAKVIEEKILNHSMHRALRIGVPFGIAYKESPQAAREVALAITEGDQRLHPDFPPRVVVTALNDSSVDMELRVHLKDPNLEVPVGFEYREKVFEALREADIEIPFPHLQLFIDEAKAFEGSRLLEPPASGAPRAEA
ncbi:MAG: mechanosensitive ion channel family protein [Bacteroidota bacterium]